MSEIEIVASRPVVSHRETVTRESAGPFEGGSWLGKSANKHNRIFVSARPIDDAVVTAMADGSFRVTGTATGGAGAAAATASESRKDDRTALATLLGVEAKRLWAVGPERRGGSSGDDEPTNVLVDCTHGLDNLHTIKDLVIAAFHEVRPLVSHVSHVLCG